MTRGLLWGILMACGLLVAAPCLAQNEPGHAQSNPGKAPTDKVPVLLIADEVTYDRDLGVVVARGHVEISRADRVIHADTVSYNERAQTVTASGNVSLTDENGNTVFADYAELTKDLKEAAIESIRLLLSDKSRLAAASGKRTGATSTSSAMPSIRLASSAPKTRRVRRCGRSRRSKSPTTRPHTR